MVESAVECEALVECALTRMAERGVAEIVGKSTGLREVLVQAERASQRASDLSNLEV